MKKLSLKASNIVSVIVTLVIIAIHYYFALPVINIHAKSFWWTLIFYIIIFAISNSLIKNINGHNSYSNGPIKINSEGITFTVEGGKKEGEEGKKKEKPVSDTTIVCLLMIFGIILFLIVGGMSSWKLFRARTYSSIITIEPADFKTDMPETTEVTNIALMDTASAELIGNRALGSLSEVVSQYELSGNYTQIDYKGTPQKISSLEYHGFFKWINNKDKGVPGYVMVDPVKNTAKYIELKTPIKYTESGCFGDDLMRKLRFAYPTKIFDSISFEIDEEGNPFYVVSCLAPKAGLFGAMDVDEVIIFNPCNGESEIMTVDKVPNWVDIVYTGNLASEKYNWYGLLSNGFWNSAIGQKGCNQTTDDFGYIMRDGDVWYYTGVTSVLADESNIGFILSNARTGEYKYYSIVGAEEYSAMSAGEGEVQEKGYVASFPSLINVADQATYIMVLKDNSGLVKLYALVNVENYSIVATGETQIKAIAAYKKLLIEQGMIADDTEIIDKDPVDVDTITKTTTVKESRLVYLNGDTYIYFTGSDGNLYKGSVSENESLMLIKVGDILEFNCFEGDTKGIYEITSWK